MSKPVALIAAVMIAINELIVDAPNLRSDYSDHERLRALWRSFKNDPVHPIVVNSKMEVIDGKSRIVGALLEGDGEVEVPCIVRDDNDPVRSARTQWATAVHRADLPLIDKANAAIFFRDSHPESNQKQIAELLGVGETMFSKLLSFERCVPEVQEAVKENKIGLRDMAHAATLPPDDQLVYLQTRLGGASVDQSQQVSKKRRKAAAPAVRVSKIKVPLVSGATVTVAGEDCSLEEAIEAMSEAVKLAKAALAKGYNCKTAQAMWRDVAAAG